MADDFKPTDEQVDIVNAFMTGENLVIEAGAGSGKTSTLRLIGRADPNRKGTYFAYNKAIAEDAKASFPANVACSTAHSLAFRAVLMDKSKLSDILKMRLGAVRLPA